MNFVLELCGCLSSGSNGTVLNEIEAYDIDSNKLSISNIYGYDTVRNSTPYYWSGSDWCKSNLTDDAKSYSSSNSTFFLYEKTNLKLTDKGRVSFQTSDSCKIIKIYYGRNSADRTPKVINLYKLKKNVSKTLNYNTVIKNFNNYIDYYDLIDSIDTTNLERLQPLIFNVNKNSEIIKTKVKEAILNNELIQNYLISYEKKE